MVFILHISRFFGRVRCADRYFRDNINGFRPKIHTRSFETARKLGLALAENIDLIVYNFTA
ncbi:MAG: hypothetical protein JSV03_03090 [Planctomycetota bacterium]|nr:MAG: hypothetical protein JSV03_03090 [Planctomycetota bacterium]